MEFNDLTEEQKAKAMACTSAEELLALAQEEDLDLTDEQLNGIAGGWGEADCSSHTSEPCNPFLPPNPC